MNNIEIEENFHDIVDSCIYGRSFVYDVLSDVDYTQIYLPEIERPISYRKAEGFKRLADARLYYQKNPVKFIEDFFKIQFVDSQAYIFQMVWMTRFNLILASRAFGKSLFMVLFAMAKQMLSSKPWIAYIASGSGNQSNTTFKKLEDVANNKITSLVGSTGELFKNELEQPNANSDGFNHSPSGFNYTLYNGCSTTALNSSTNRNRGKRGNCLLMDEVGFLTADYIRIYAAFCAVNEGFVTGFDKNGNPIDIVRSVAMPKDIPNQLVYVSSASSVDTEFYRMYRDYSKQMLSGNKNYFVANINCELVMTPTIHNIPTTSALTRDQIESEGRTNPLRCRREYYCEFTTDVGADAIVKRGAITRNEETYKPVHENETKKAKYIIAYDPARQRDNSVISVMEVYNEELPDGTIEKKGRLVNCVNLVDVGKKIKSPMQTPDQIEYLKEMILAYDGGTINYDNILAIYIDAGSGGSGVNIADYLMSDWKDKAGITHRGLIDKAFSEEYVKRFPNAVDKVKLLAPSKYKSTIFECLIEMINQNKVTFTSAYDNRGYLTIFDENDEAVKKQKDSIIKKYQKKNMDENEREEMINEEISKIQMKTKTIKLDWRDELALANIDAMKEEIVSFVRKKRDNGDSFDLAPEKAKKIHDDRAYTLALLCYGLSEERRKELLKKKVKPVTTLVDKLPIITSRKI